MRQPTSKNHPHRQPSLNAIPGGKEETIKLAAIAWTFAYSALWNCTQFSTLEKQAAQGKIAGYLRLSNNSRRAFRSFCERILLAKLFMPEGTVSLYLPSVWLDRNHAKGFSETRIPYREVKTLRKSLPLYKYEWKALAEAVLEFGEEPTAENFHYWKSYFTEKQASGLLQLFQVYASNHLLKM